MSPPAGLGVRVVLAAAALAPLGCGSEYVAGGARASLACAPGKDEPPPITGAVLTVRCPGSAAPRLRVVSGADGRFLAKLDDPVPLDCDVHVEASGFAPRDYTPGEVCALDADPAHPFWKAAPPPACAALSVPARLFPLPAAEARP